MPGEAEVRRWIEENPERAKKLWRRANTKQARDRRRQRERERRLLKKLAKADRRRLAPPPPDPPIYRCPVDEIDNHPLQCQWRFWCKDGGCQELATWGKGPWRACEKHKLRGDRPLSELDEPPKLGAPVDDGW